MRIGYLVGQFPLPTHTFIWRDVCAIEAMGVEVDLVSTRRPTLERASHQWCQEAVARTTYLVEEPAAIGAATIEALLTRPVAVARCARACARFTELGAAERARVVALIPIAARLTSLARSRGWSHVHVAFPTDTGFVALFASLLGSVPYSLAHHCNPKHLGAGVNMAEKWARAAFGAAVTERLRQDLRDELGSVGPETVLIAPMGVDLGRFTRRTPFEPWSGQGVVRLFSCGRLVPDKGHVEVVRALAILVQRGVDATLRIAGGAPEGAWFSTHLRDVIREEGMQARVTLLGAIAEERVRDEMEAAHAFVLATYDEGLGIAFAEAMAMEMPVLGTAVGGVPELITSGVDGVLVRPRDAKAVADGLMELLADPNVRRYGIAARRRVEAAFTSSVGARVLVDELQRRYA